MGEAARASDLRWRLKNPEHARALVNARVRRRMGRRRALIARVKDRPCHDCGVPYPKYVMQFDHRDPLTKSFTVGLSLSVSLSRLLEEIEKCDVVCANCHAERTHRRRQESAV